MKNRSYNHYCGLAYALDMVGERWTLLIIREVIPGPRRFTDLMDGLPGISTNLLSERLKSLEQHSILKRRILPPPAASTVYELTDLGHALEPMLLELGKWGSQFVPPSRENAALLPVGSYALTLKTFFSPEETQGINETYVLHIDRDVLQVRIAEGEIDVQYGETPNADMVLHTDMSTYLGLLQGQMLPGDAITKGLVQIEGDPNVLRRFLKFCGMPGAGG